MVAHILLLTIEEVGGFACRETHVVARSCTRAVIGALHGVGVSIGRRTVDELQALLLQRHAAHEVRDACLDGQRLVAVGRNVVLGRSTACNAEEKK